MTSSNYLGVPASPERQGRMAYKIDIQNGEKYVDKNSDGDITAEGTTNLIFQSDRELPRG